jgi:hypothetical protein
LLLKDNEEVNLQVKRLHAMLDATTMMDPALNPGVGRGGQDPDHCQSLLGTRPIAYQPLGWSKAMVRVEKTFGTFFVPRMLMTRSKIVGKREIVPIMSTTMRGTMISMAPTTTSQSVIGLRLEATMQEGSSRSPMT